MKLGSCTLAVTLLLMGHSGAGELLDVDPPAEATSMLSSASPVMRMETLLKSALAAHADTEVIVSRVELPPHTTLPEHWHPGEEFAYVIEGQVFLWLGEQSVSGHAGELLKVPYKQAHWAGTGDEGATLLIFRVHEAGEPERVAVE
ncbi:cupin domain-containing protein [Ferrimonas gelatinilytica]|uniref:Cupin type-2 domain-containing protein n=1 Tax=Ferrimonas gelatinilytica TaxID=1255257 RepID=A0ABP9SE24_9GAMM